MSTTFSKTAAAEGFVTTYVVRSEADTILGQVSKDALGKWQAQSKQGKNIGGVANTRIVAVDTIRAFEEQRVVDAAARKVAKADAKIAAAMVIAKAEAPKIEEAKRLADAAGQLGAAVMQASTRTAPMPNTAKNASYPSIHVACSGYENNNVATPVKVTTWSRIKAWVRGA